MTRNSKDYERLDPHLFRAFMAAAEAKNFTLAAKMAAMTQSGISQQVAKLEEQLGVQLFARSNKSVLLTDAGQQLVQFIESYLDSTAELQNILRKGSSELAGTVTYGMPESCLLSPHLSMLLRKRHKHPNIELNITIEPNHLVLEGVLSGKLEFGFITESVDIAGLTLTPYCEEEFVLIAPTDWASKKIDRDSLSELPWVIYPGMEPYVSQWFKHYFPKSLVPRPESFVRGGAISSIHGALRLVAGGVGLSIVPLHCAEQLLSAKEYTILKPTAAKGSVKGMIYVATLSSRSLVKRTRQVIDWFFAMHPEIER